MADNANTPIVDPVDKPGDIDPLQKLADQDISGKSLAPDINSDAGDALDKLMKEHETKTTANDDEAQKAEAEKKAADEKAKQEEEARKAAESDPAKIEADKQAAAKLEEERKRADELFKDSPSLPPGASPKSSEAFATIKVKAAQEISARDAQIEELRKKNQELEAKAQKSLSPEQEKEITSLREWRAKLDVEADPKFKEFDKQISSASEFVYAQLRKSGMENVESVIAEIKKWGGPHKVKLEKVLEVITDPTIKRLIESKSADIEHIAFNRDQAVKDAKDNIATYVQNRQKEAEQAATKHNADTQALLKRDAPKMDFLQKKELPAGADEATKKSIEAHNKSVDEINQNIQDAANDDSPEMRAIMLFGMGKLLHVQPKYEAAQKRIAELEKQLKESTDKIEEFKKASTSRLRESAAPPSGKLPDTNEGPNLNIRTVDALDAAMAKVVEENARAAGRR